MSKTGELTDDCLKLIESQLNWGDSANWGQYDFQKLSDLIEDKTGVLLSVTTLKRLWGKLKYDNLPSMTTLNTLARFVGYEDWRAFGQREKGTANNTDPSFINEETNNKLPDQRGSRGLAAEPLMEQTNSIINPPQVQARLGANDRLEVDTPRRRSRGQHYRAKRFMIAGLLAFIAVMALVSLTTRRKQVADNSAAMQESSVVPAPDPAKFSFKANKVVGEGVPNSVVFSYDAAAAKTDSVFIVQTWDIRRKTLVPVDGTHHSAIYYYPGFFRTKLIVDGKVVKAHDLQITSGGWLCLAEQDPTPVYFRKEAYIKKDRVEIDVNQLSAFGLKLHPQPPKIRFFNQGDMGNLMSDNFVFETTLRNDFNEGAGVCQPVQVLIQCKDDIIIIPLSAPACVGDLRLSFCGIGADSKSADLSGFGCDLTKWTKLKVTTIDRFATIFVNDKKAFSLTFPNDATGIVGVQYRFFGTGAVKDTRFIGAGKVHNL